MKFYKEEKESNSLLKEQFFADFETLIKSFIVRSHDSIFLQDIV